MFSQFFSFAAGFLSSLCVFFSSSLDSFFSVFSCSSSVERAVLHICLAAVAWVFCRSMALLVSQFPRAIDACGCGPSCDAFSDVRTGARVLRTARLEGSNGRRRQARCASRTCQVSLRQVKKGDGRREAKRCRSRRRWTTRQKTERRRRRKRRREKRKRRREKRWVT
ncbi:putative transmembrane protein [Toxoplasma gondii TgCatPRC2]|uniref:Putative transmembrane protein n=1 Tax=Toxoplasma gondii TgCatPRC2 TaxID=1130821 RepID=A0A151HLP5_TOXGO|nr:putative transmembrane protein [Toxoplasma gondii TgCatPRC2]